MQLQMSKEQTFVENELPIYLFYQLECGFFREAIYQTVPLIRECQTTHDPPTLRANYACPDFAMKAQAADLQLPLS